MGRHRDAAKKLMQHWNTREIEENRKYQINDIEAFAEQIERETIERCAGAVVGYTNGDGDDYDLKAEAAIRALIEPSKDLSK